MGLGEYIIWKGDFGGGANYFGDRMYMTGFADGQTNWCDEKGGNVTVKGDVRFYQRKEEWVLTMDKLSA